MLSNIEQFGSNITLLYDNLPLETIDRSSLRAVLKASDTVAMDTPEVVVMFSPSTRIILQLGDRRIRITDQGTQRPDQSALPELAVRAQALGGNQRLSAYGFNYDVRVHSEGGQPTTDLLKQRFLPEQPVLAERLEGELISTVPRLIFQRGNARYDLILQAEDRGSIAAHLNVHFESAALPDGKLLADSFVAEAQRLVATLKKLLE